MADDYLFERMVEIIETEKRNYELLKECKKTLLNLKRRDSCWCEKAIGNPMVKHHSDACIQARELMEKLECTK